ncbi:MAG TPA: hypothetical protein VII91_06470 [Bauldia sp.]
MPAAWETFYFMVGSSSAGLIGLLFVVVTLSADTTVRRAEIASKTFVTPTVFHFGVIFFISTVAVMPEVPIGAMALAIAVISFLGVLFAGAVIARLVRGAVAITHWSDYLFYGALPAVAYVCLIAAAAGLWLDAPFALHGVAAAMLFLLLLGIRDAWDLATWLSYHRNDG